MEDDFTEVINEKLAIVQEKIRNQNSKVLNPLYHSRRLTEALQEAVVAVNVNDGEQIVVKQLMEILNKAPSYVASGFTEALQEVAFLKREMSVWASVNTEWQNFETQIMEDKNRREELKEAIKAGEVEERTVRTRREPGNHPGPSTREIRNVKAELEEEALPGLEESGS